MVQKHLKLMMNWCYSWMKNDCETYLHFKYSYYLLCKYLFSIQVISLFGMAFPNNVLTFLRKHVLTWEKWFLYCHRSTVRHYCEYNNNPLEGTNNSIKNSSIATHPQFTLENSFEVLFVLKERSN